MIGDAKNAHSHNNVCGEYVGFSQIWSHLSMLSTSLRPQRYDDWKRSLYEHTGMSLHIMHAIVLWYRILEGALVRMQTICTLGTNFSTSLRHQIYDAWSYHTMHAIVLWYRLLLYWREHRLVYEWGIHLEQISCKLQTSQRFQRCHVWRGSSYEHLPPHSVIAGRCTSWSANDEHNWNKFF